jgi:uncharacterized Zn-binding protein involved in type VI secretion
MPAVQRQGDPNGSGGVNTSGVASVRVNGRPIVVPGISVSPHPCCGQSRLRHTLFSSDIRRIGHSDVQVVVL